MNTILYMDDGTEKQLPTKNEVCGNCRGEGSHVNRAIDGNGITSSEMDEILHDDPEFLDNYMSGVYDVPCDECHGKRVVPVVDRSRVSDEEWQEYQEQCEIEAAWDAEREAERRMGC